MTPGPIFHGRPPRPVAGLPDLDGVAVAKAWLLELLSYRPLEDVASVPVQLLAREAPALCSAIADAVADDGALARLRSGDRAALAARAGVLSGALGPADVVTAVDALRAVVHRALRTGDDAALAADTGDRVAHVCAHVAARALTDAPSTLPGTSAGSDPASLQKAAQADPPPEAGKGPRAGPEGGHVSALRSALTNAAGPVAVLAIEVDGLERLVAVEGEEAIVTLLESLERSLAGAAGHASMLIREQPGRWWLIAPGLGSETGRSFAEQIATIFVEAAPLHRGARLTASIGIAVFPDDGHDVEALLDHSDQGVFTARALGVPIA